MDSAISKKQQEKLARVRENQRKSRARKQDHIRDLEQRLLVFQKEAYSKDVEYRLTVQRLESENQKLRYLLSSSGFPSNVLDAYLNQVDNPVTTQKVAIPALPRRTNEPNLQNQESPCARPCSSTGNRTSETPSPNDTKDPETCLKDDNIGFDQHSTWRDSPRAQKSATQTFCDCLPDENTESLPIEQALNTTLCAIAEELISQYNTRGVELSEIQRRLRAGFTRGLASEGCRVQNQILFQVLDEISND